MYGPPQALPEGEGVRFRNGNRKHFLNPKAPLPFKTHWWAGRGWGGDSLLYIVAVRQALGEQVWIADVLQADASYFGIGSLRRRFHHDAFANMVGSQRRISLG